MPRDRTFDDLEQRVIRASQPPIRRRVIGRQASGYAIWELLIPARKRITDSKPPLRILLNGGTHGDEPAGVETLLQFLEQKRYEAWTEISFFVVPCLNPWGYVENSRNGPAGRDLNRAFRRSSVATPEVAAMKRAFGRRQVAFLMDCHEDCDADGFYAYEIPEVSSLGTKVVDAVGAIGPISTDCVVDEEIPVRDGLAQTNQLRVRVLEEMLPNLSSANRSDFNSFVRAWPSWPLPIYLWHRHQAPAFTFETPTNLPLSQRAAMQLAGIRTVLNSLSQR